MKVWMMTDHEGLSGVRTPDECVPGTPKWEAARKFLVSDVNAAVRGAFDGGATEVVVRDGHWEQFNLLLDQMDPRAVYSGPCRQDWCPGLDESVDAAFVIGIHAMAGTAKAFLDHTQSAESWYRFTVNGREMGELGQFGAYCGAVGVPVTLVTGDEAACAEARAFFPGCETVPVKVAVSRNSALCLHPERAAEMIRDAAQRAVERAKNIQPFVVTFPAEVVLEFMRTDYADGMTAKRGVRRVNSRTCAWTAAKPSEFFL